MNLKGSRGETAGIEGRKEWNRNEIVTSRLCHEDINFFCTFLST